MAEAGERRRGVAEAARGGGGATVVWRRRRARCVAAVRARGEAAMARGGVEIFGSLAASMYLLVRLGRGLANLVKNDHLQIWLLLFFPFYFSFVQ